ncbi:gamma-tubulin complex component 6, partial [Mytilus galloprovincialis]
ESIRSVLTLLVALAEFPNQTDKEVVGYGETKYPVVRPEQTDTLVLPWGPQCYGDCHVTQPDNKFYMHYPLEIFMADPVRQPEPFTKIFQVTPGTDLQGNSLFNVKGYLNDQHERMTTGTLFGGLVQGKFTSLEDKLELPDLPDDEDSGMFEIRIPSVQSIDKMVLDDKASTGIDTMSCSIVSLDSGIDTSIWEECLSHVLSKHYTWESSKCGPGSTEKRPYITEAGPEALDEWYNMKRREINILCPSVTLPPRRLVSQRELCQNIISVMLGIPSVTFELYAAVGKFDIKEGTHFTGITPRSLNNICQDFMECGAIYIRLNYFSLPQTMDSFYKKGLIFQAFIGAIRKVLQHYRAVVLSIRENMTVLRMKFQCHQLFKQMRFLARLCQCEEQFDQHADLQFPSGIELLSYVYKETLESTSSDSYPMMLSILQTTCAPYLLCLEDWIYHGRYRDIYGEFMIQVNEDYIQFRDKHYWTHGFTLTTSDVMDSVPLFLRDYAKKIFSCGKSVNLLKTCCPDHFLCKLEDFEIPRIMVTYSSEEMEAIKVQCDIYVSKMKQIANKISTSREEMKARAEKAKQDLIRKAREVAERELKEYQEKVLAVKKKVDERKRKQFEFLKDQMKTDLQRRASVKEANKEEDRQFIARVTRAEEALTEKEIELERKTKEEIEEYYSKLTEEAAFREQKALWRVRRAKLDLDRINFLQQDTTHWSSQMEANPEPMRAEDFPDTVALPAWADKGLSSRKPIVVGDSTLPKWAVKGGVQMPDWARKELADDEVVFENVDEEKISTAGRPSTPRMKRLPSPRVKTGIKLNDSFSASAETEEADVRSGIQTYQHANATKETEGVEKDKYSIRMVGEMNATKESTQEDEFKSHIKVRKDMHATKETESNDDEFRPHNKPNLMMSSTTESTNVQETSFPKLKRNKDMDSNTETEAAIWKIKKPSVFGHPSQMTKLDSVEIAAPKLKRSLHFHASLESELRDFGIKPRIRISKNMYASKESEPSVIKRLRIKKSEQMWATKESEMIDHDALRLEKFKTINVYGHSSDSTVQKLLYGDKHNRSYDDTDTKGFTVVFTEVQVLEKFSYEDQFDHLGNPFVDKHEPAVDLLSSSVSTLYGGFGDYGINLRSNVDIYKYMPLPELFKHSVTKPLRSQIFLINKSVIDYFTVELQIEEHFQALRRYLLMGDGDFSQFFSDLLFDKLSSNPKPKEMLNPVFLNGVLTKSLRSSMHADDVYADNLSFAIKYVPQVLQQTAHDTLDCLELRYKVVWPLNIVITDSLICKYSKVFSFMLQLKRIVWSLKDVWHRLKRGAIIHKAGNSVQFRQLQLYRQEMQHFVKVMQGYVASQIIHVSWKEFTESLTTDVKDLDDLHRIHSEYLNKTIFRCLLNKKASPVMKIIQDIFSLILKFRVQLINAEWYTDPESGQLTHTNFANMVSLYKAFREYSVFLFKVVYKLSVRGYQPHLQELLLRLNFNDYYKDR